MKAVLESCHEILRRPQFDKATYHRDGDYSVETATCGCKNRTRIIEDGASCDGVTYLCNEHDGHCPDCGETNYCQCDA